MKTDIGILHVQISRGKRFILSWKVGENEFFKVVGTMFNLLIIFRFFISSVCCNSNLTCDYLDDKRTCSSCVVSQQISAKSSSTDLVSFESVCIQAD